MTIKEELTTNEENSPQTLNAQSQLDIRMIADLVKWFDEHNIIITRISSVVKKSLIVLLNHAVRNEDDRFAKTDDAIEYLERRGFALPSLRSKGGNLTEKVLRQIQIEDVGRELSKIDLQDAGEFIDRAFEGGFEEEGE